MDILLLINDDKSHVYIKDFNTFMFHKTKNKNKKNGFVKVVYNALVVKMFCQSIKEIVEVLMVNSQ